VPPADLELPTGLILRETCGEIYCSDATKSQELELCSAVLMFSETNTLDVEVLQ